MEENYVLQCFEKPEYIKGIIIGRAQLVNKMDKDKWLSLIKTKKELDNIPIIINTDFGHTTLIFTFPIGGEIEIKDAKIIIKNK